MPNDSAGLSGRGILLPGMRLSHLKFNAILAVQSTLFAQAPSGSGLDAARLETIRPRLQALVDNQTIPGAVALVARHGKLAVLDAVGWRDFEGRKPMQTDSIFQIMSMTKNFTGVAVMMLVEEGKIELRQPIEHYLPEFRGIQVEEKPINGPGTVHSPKHLPMVWQLMSHTSGLGGDPEGELADNPRTMRVPLAEAVRFYGRSHLEFEPGTRWSYSNMGIAALGRLIEVISGEDYVHFVRTRILEPLGMKDSFFFPPREKQDRIALVYKHAAGKLVRAGDEILAGDAARYREGAKYPAPEIRTLLYGRRPVAVLPDAAQWRRARQPTLSIAAVGRDNDARFHAGCDAFWMAGRHGLWIDVRDCESAAGHAAITFAGHIRPRRRIRDGRLDRSQERFDPHHAGASFGRRG